MNGCCNCYFVVEGDGSVYPCDFYCMDAWKLGTVKDGFVQMKTSEKQKHLWRLPDRSVQPVMNVRIFLCAEAAAADGASRLWMESRG